MSEYGFGIVGLGMIAEFHAKAIGAMTGGRLVAAFSRDAGKAAKFCAEHGGNPYSDMAEFLADPDLQVVTVCTPSGLHLGPAEEAAAAGKHVVVEKPLEITPERCDGIISACEKAGVKLATVFPSRFSDAAQLVKKTIDSGRLGKLALGSAYIKWFRTQEYYDSGAWRGTWELDGGGALMNQSIHAIDLLQWFMGPVEAVTAQTDCLAHQRIEVEDVAAAVLKFTSGALGVIEGSTAAYPGQLKRLEVCGSAGSLVLEQASLKQWQFAEEIPEDEETRKRFAGGESSGGQSDPKAISFAGHQRQFEDFVKALDGGQPLVDGAEGRKSVEIINAIYMSAREGGKPVKLPL
ncbi:MAG: Gfo/Idh/MocA family protein [Planctomycetota bacterium]|jgi:predicted dehydrogenase